MQSYQRRGHALDTGFHYVGGLAEGQPMHEVFSQLGLMHLPWHRMDPEGFDRITILSPDGSGTAGTTGRTFCLAEGFDRFVEVLAADFPHQREALQRYVDMLQGPDPAFNIGAWQWLSDNFSDPLLVDVLAGSCLKTELRRDSMPLFAFVHSQKSFIQSSWLLKGDSSQIVRSLTDDIRRMGGEVVCRAEVQELVEHNGLLTTARCSNGEEYQGRCFISDIHPALTVSLVKESQRMKKVFRRRISALENTAGLYTWSLVLKPQTLRYFNHNKYVYRGGSVWDDATERVAISCRVPDDGSDYATLLDLMTTGAADPLPLAECVLPGLRDMVSEQYVSSPATWQRFTHTPNGSAFGVRNDYRNSLMTMLSPMTPIPNLLLTGQSLALPGVEGVVMTALETLRLIGSLGVWEFRSMGV